MGTCFSSSTKSTAEIAPFDLVVKPPALAASSAAAQTRVSAQRIPTATPAVTASSAVTVKLYGPPNSLVTSYLRFALLHKKVSLRFVPSEDQKPTIQVGSETVSGSLEVLLRYIEDKFPEPRLMICKFNLEGFDESTPLIVRTIWLQHKSMLWHMARMLRWSEDLAARGGRRAVDPSVGTPKMEIRKFAKSYTQLQELMVEHAQMEERILFPVLESVDRGMCKSANEEHGRELPMMNGIKEDIKSIGVLDAGICSEALSSLASRFKTLQMMCKAHFEEEEKDLLPMVEAAEMGKEKQKKLMNQSLEVMRGSHSHLFDFLLQGLTPQEAMQYLDLLMKFGDPDLISSFLCHSLIVD
uniref:Hemerythrin-like domain-containing protein n=1 Tax=Noccaea caerulescens TaxID=107243 RepID=A0A1J3GFS2_NOCCA